MPASLWKWDWDYVIHFAIGVVFVLLFSLTRSTVATFVAAAFCLPFGWLREKKQHDWQELTPHQIAEAWLWFAGGITGACVALLWTH